MFNLNESNRIVMAQHSGNIRIGANGMCGQEVQLLLTLPFANERGRAKKVTNESEVWHDLYFVYAESISRIALQ